MMVNCLLSVYQHYSPAERSILNVKLRASPVTALGVILANTRSYELKTRMLEDSSRTHLYFCVCLKTEPLGNGSGRITAVEGTKRQALWAGLTDSDAQLLRGCVLF